MPVYNVKKYVERALLSALNQTFESIEYLIVDDKGTDNSIDIVREIIANHPRGRDVRIIDHGVNQGTGATKNSAIKEAKGEYLYFMDSDDEITKDCIEILYNKMQENPVDFVCGSYSDIRLNGLIKEHKLVNLILNDKEEIYSYDQKSTMPGGTWNKLYSLIFLKKNNIKCISHHLCEDQIFTFLVLFHATSCILISNLTYYYYENDNSFMARQRKQRGYDYKTANEFNEILSFRKEYIKSNIHPQMLSMCRDNIIKAMDCSYTIIRSPALPLIKKINYLKLYLNFRDLPIKSCDIKTLKPKYYFLISNFPKYILYAIVCYTFFWEKISHYIKSYSNSI
ncbi:putative glycosyltransferase EpsH [termite gut metagenome]|uniref:Putative glycosyltransferase EpsH n=1 Tax=termite gut metagenome TaxID=433724 RepID=A0A5J4SAH2_9ZZZZ